MQSTDALIVLSQHAYCSVSRMLKERGNAISDEYILRMIAMAIANGHRDTQKIADLVLSHIAKTGAPECSLIQRPPEPRHRDRHRDQHQDQERGRVEAQIGER